LEGVIESERKRAQQSIDYVRQTLKAKIRVLEAQVETDRESDTKIKKEKREVARELKQVMRKLDEKKSEVGRDKRRIETLEKQVDSFKDRLDKVTIETGSLEQKHYSLIREVATLSTQVDAALYTNAKLNVLIPNQIRLAIEEEAVAEKAKGEKPKELKEYQPRERKEVKELYEPSKLKEEVQERKEVKELYEPSKLKEEEIKVEEHELKEDVPLKHYDDDPLKKDDDLFDTSVSLDIETDKGTTDEFVSL